MKPILLHFSDFMKSMIKLGQRQEMTLKDGAMLNTSKMEIQTDDGPVELHDFQEEMPDPAVPRIMDPLPLELEARFLHWRDQAPLFLITYCTPKSKNELKQYDEAFKAWQYSTTKVHSDDDVIAILGAYLGYRMTDDFGMQWAVWTDSRGENHAIIHEVVKVTAFPFSSVMKRIEDRENDFIHGVYHVIKSIIDDFNNDKSQIA